MKLDVKATLSKTCISSQPSHCSW